MDSAPPAMPPPRTPADRGRAITSMAAWMAAGAVVLGGGIALNEFWPFDAARPEAAAPALLSSRAVDMFVLARMTPPVLAPRNVPTGTATAVAAAPAAAGTTTPAIVPTAIAPPPSRPPASTPPAAPPGRVTATTDAAVAPSVRTELLRAHDRWFAAYARGDAARLAALEADGFRMLDWRTPADRVSRGASVDRSLERVSVDVSGDAVVLAARMVEHVATADGSARAVLSDLSEVWMPSGTGWRLLGIVIRPAP